MLAKTEAHKAEEETKIHAAKLFLDQVNLKMYGLLTVGQLRGKNHWYKPSSDTWGSSSKTACSPGPRRPSDFLSGGQHAFPLVSPTPVSEDVINLPALRTASSIALNVL